MKATLVFACLLLVTAPLALGQDAMMDPVKEALVAMEKQGWDAWKNHDGAFFEASMADEAVNITPGGMTDKAQMIRDIAGAGCDVRSFSLDKFKMIKLGTEAALLTYEAQQDATCNEYVLPAKVLATSVYVKQGEKWMNMLYQETPIAE